VIQAPVFIIRLIIGIGYMLNFGNRWSWAVLAVIVVLVLAPIVPSILSVLRVVQRH